MALFDVGQKWHAGSHERVPLVDKWILLGVVMLQMTHVFFENL